VCILRVPELGKLLYDEDANHVEYLKFSKKPCDQLSGMHAKVKSHWQGRKVCLHTTFLCLHFMTLKSKWFHITLAQCNNTSNSSQLLVNFNKFQNPQILGFTRLLALQGKQLSSFVALIFWHNFEEIMFFIGRIWNHS
jgi:hypothetical protein